MKESGKDYDKINSPDMTWPLRAVGHIRSDFPTKFGIPRQSGLAPDLVSVLTFSPEYDHPDCFKGIEQYSHLWLLWGFSGSRAQGWSPTVRPPRLGGNAHVGVFASRSPFRPNHIGLSCVRLLAVRREEKSRTSLVLGGADLMDGTPVFDVKPYLPYADSHPEAAGGFATAGLSHRLSVYISRELEECLPPEKRAALLEALSLDPRPSYHSDPARVYGMEYAGYEVRFTVDGETLRVTEIRPCPR